VEIQAERQFFSYFCKSVLNPNRIIARKSAQSLLLWASCVLDIKPFLRNGSSIFSTDFSKFTLSSFMKRFHFSLSITVVFLVAALTVIGCKAPTVDYQLSQFATLRVMNFSPNCTAPMDVFWTLAGQTRQTQANVYNLQYGAASVYTNLLQAGNYNVLVTPHLIPTESDLMTNITLAGNQKYTLVITRPTQSGAFNTALIQDGVPNPSQTMTYVRFMNLQPGAGPLTVRVNDPISGAEINPIADTFGQVSSYVTLTTAPDTSYTFFVTNSSNQVIARLGYQTFTAGNCYSLVYAGDLCNTVLTNPADTTGGQSSDDTLRLRAFDDNSSGNDLTNPVTASFRYNIVNGIAPLNQAGAAQEYYDAQHPNDTTLGFLVNGQGFPEFYGYSIPPIPVFQGGGENVGTFVNGALEVNYQSAIVPNPLVIQAFATNANGSYQQSTFTAGGSKYPLSEGTPPPTGLSLLYSSGWNKPYTLLFFDTVPTPWANLDSTAPGKFAIIPVPDVSNPDAATIVFIAGIVIQNPNKSTTTNYSSWWVTNPSGTVYTPPSNVQHGLTSGHSSTLTIPITAGSTAQLDVTDSIGSGTSSSSPRVPGNSTSFTAQAGGIYEIISLGTKVNPHLLIMHVNANQ
jgi:hypothetical protein